MGQSNGAFGRIGFAVVIAASRPSILEVGRIKSAALRDDGSGKIKHHTESAGAFADHF